MNWKELIWETTVIICTTVLAGMALHVFECGDAVCMISILLIFFAIIIAFRFILEVVKDRKILKNLIDSKDEVIKNLKEQLNNNESLKKLKEDYKRTLEDKERLYKDWELFYDAKLKREPQNQGESKSVDLCTKNFAEVKKAFDAYQRLLH